MHRSDASDAPTYLGLLNAIAVAEHRAHAVLTAWRDATPNPDLARVLEVVALRKREHAAAFTKRLCELGYGLRQSPSQEFEKSLALAGADADDAAKFRDILEYGSGEESDPLARIFEDRSIDPQTGALLGRFIAEERDSERRLREAWSRLGPPRQQPAEQESDAALLTEIAERLDRLGRTLEELKQLRR